MRIRSFLTAGLLLVLIGTQGVAQEAQKIQERPNRPVFHGLDLSEPQLEQMKTIRIESSKELLPLKKSLNTRQSELEELMVAEKPNQRVIDGKIDEIQALRANIQKRHVAAQLQTRELLTEDQRVKWDSFRERRNSGRRFRDMRAGPDRRGMGRPGMGRRGPGRFNRRHPGMGAGRPGKFRDRQRRGFDSEGSSEIETL